MNRRENTTDHNNFPNHRAIISRLERVNDDVRLSGFYKAVSKHWGDASLPGDKIISDWRELVSEHLSDQWLEYVENNFASYFRTLFWHQNPVFANWIVSVYQQLDPIKSSKKKTPAPALKKPSIPDVTFEPKAETGEDESIVKPNATVFTTEDGKDETIPDEFEDLFDIYLEKGTAGLTVGQIKRLQEAGRIPATIEVVSKPEETTDEVDFDNMKYMELRKYAENNDIDISGLRKKDDILEAVLEAQTKP